MQRPTRTGGLRHVALTVENLEACEQFYVDLLGMEVEWRPDPVQPLDHIGFIIPTPEQVDEWYAFLDHHAVPMRQPPRTHRDGARSFYCYDPAGTVVQIIYHPPIS